MKQYIHFIASFILVAVGCSTAEAQAPVFGFWPSEKFTKHTCKGSARNCITEPLSASSGKFIVVARWHNLTPRSDRRYSKLTPNGFSPAQGICLTSLRGDTLTALLSVKGTEGVEYAEHIFLDIKISSVSGVVTQQSLPLPAISIQKMSSEWCMRLSATYGQYSVELATPDFANVCTVDAPGFAADNAGIMLEPGAALQLCNFAYMLYPDGRTETEAVNVDSLQQQLLSSRDMLEGVWDYYDRTLDESLLRPGGRYRLLIKRIKQGCYNLYYLAGAEKNPDLWRRGMLKGRLEALPTGKYVLEWRDAEGVWMQKGLTAFLEDASTLTLLFPSLSGTVRFVRTGP